MVARFWPVDAVVGENGAFWMWHDARLGKLRTRFIQSEAERADGRRRLEAVRADVLREVPGAGIASDQPYRLADLAVDFCEDVPPLPSADIERIVAIFERHGAHAKVSSIHVNGWFGDYDKLTTSKTMMARALRRRSRARGRTLRLLRQFAQRLRRCSAFSPMASASRTCVTSPGRCRTLPRWVTQARSGAGFVELARGADRGEIVRDAWGRHSHTPSSTSW